MQDRRAELHLASPRQAAPGLASSHDWWLGAGDPVLARLVDQGLSGSASLACEGAAATAGQGHGSARAHRTRAAIAETGYRYADDRARGAAAIAHAYIAVRKWQSLLALRMAEFDQYRDNAEIAQFRREAGLVSAIDGGLAGALSAQNDGQQDRTRARLETGFAALATLVGIPPDDLKAQLGEDTAVPDLGPTPSAASAALADFSARPDLRAVQGRLERRLARQKVSQASIDQALAAPVDAQRTPPASPAQDAVAQWRHAFALADADIRALAAAAAGAEAQLLALSAQDAAAQRAVADARLAYRAGAGDFPTLFVTEVAALGIREALVEARADRAGAMIDLHTARGDGWSPAAAAAALSAATARRGADCE